MKHLKLYNMTTETKANDVITGFNGLTKREYFAAMAMQGIISKMYDPDGFADADDDMVCNACVYADLLIDELNASR